MTLTDIMSSSGFATLQSIASLIFVLAFVAIVLRVALRPRDEIRRQAHLPLDEEPAGPELHSRAGERR